MSEKEKTFLGGSDFIAANTRFYTTGKNQEQETRQEDEKMLWKKSKIRRRKNSTYFGVEK